MVNIPGFASMGLGGVYPSWGGAGAFGSPVAAARARDPRYAYALALLKGAGDTSPVSSPWQGLSRLGQGLVAGMMYRGAENDWKNQQADYSRTMANALQAGTGQPAETKTYGNGGDPTTISWDAVAPDPQKQISILAANPYTAPQAMQMQQQQAIYQRERADKLSDMRTEQQFTLNRDKIQNDYTTARTNLQIAAENARQDKSIEAQQKLQSAQQDFTAAQNNLNRAIEQQKVYIEAGKMGMQLGNQVMTNEEKMADDFRAEPTVTAYRQIVPVWNSMVDAAKNDSRASDLNLVYGLAKIMDPNSVVREGEMVMVNNTASLPDWLIGQINGLNGGARLQADTRNAIMREAGSRAQQFQNSYDTTATQYKNIATTRKLNPDHIVIGSPARRAFEPTLNAEDKAALDWATANPNDPRAAQIRQKLGR